MVQRQTAPVRQVDVGMSLVLVLAFDAACEKIKVTVKLYTEATNQTTTALTACIYM